MSKLNVKRVNVKETKSSPSRVYIGRANTSYGFSRSELANPFVIGKDGNREEVVSKYRSWLWEQVKEGLAGKNSVAWKELKFLKRQAKQFQQSRDERYLSIEPLTLACWCKENEKCHGDVVISCLNWMNDNNLGE